MSYTPYQYTLYILPLVQEVLVAQILVFQGLLLVLENLVLLESQAVQVAQLDL